MKTLKKNKRSSKKRKNRKRNHLNGFQQKQRNGQRKSHINTDDLCPCGSGKKFKDCHRKIFNKEGDGYNNVRTTSETLRSFTDDEKKVMKEFFRDPYHVAIYHHILFNQEECNSIEISKEDFEASLYTNFEDIKEYYHENINVECNELRTLLKVNNSFDDYKKAFNEGGLLSLMDKLRFTSDGIFGNVFRINPKNSQRIRIHLLTNEYPTEEIDRILNNLLDYDNFFNIYSCSGHLQTDNIMYFMILMLGKKILEDAEIQKQVNELFDELSVLN